MADREIRELGQEGVFQDGVYMGDGSLETVRGGGRVGVIASSYEARQQRVILAGPEQGLISGDPDARLLSRGEAARGMAHLEQRAADAIAGTAVQTAQAMDRLAGQAATAMQQTAESSQRAVSHLEGQTREAFGRTEGALGVMSENLASNAERLAVLETALANERQRHAQAEEKLRKDQQITVDALTDQLNEALARVDRLSADLAKERSLPDVRQPLHSPRPIRQQPVAPMQDVFLQPVLPPHLQQGDEIRPDPAQPQRRRPQSQQVDHPRRHRSVSRSSRGSHHSRSPSASAGAAPSRAGSVRREGITSGVFDVPIKPRDPPTFAGRTQDDPEVWVGQVSNFFRLVGGSAQKQVAYASTLLSGTAQTWWQRKCKAWEEPQDWETFADQLVRRFRNTNKADAAMANLMNIKQRKEESTHDFICRFEAELDKVESYDESWVLKMFIWGLPQDQAVLVSQGKPTRLTQAFQLARDAALAAQMARRPGGSGKTEGSSSQKGQGRGQGKSTGQHAGTGQSSAPNTAYQAQGYHVQQGGKNRGRGQAGRPPAPPQPVVVRQPAQHQASGSGQRGRNAGNQRRPRAAALAAQDDQGMAGPSDQEAAQHAAVSGTDASLRQRQGN